MADAAAKLTVLEERVGVLERELAGKDARIVALEGDLAVLEGKPRRIACFGSSSSKTPQKCA